MDKTQFKNRLYDIVNVEYAYYKDYETFYDLKGYLLEQDKEKYFNFVDAIEGVYMDFYDIENFDETYSNLREALKDLYEETIQDNEENINMNFIYDDNDNTFDFTVNGVSFFNENFLNVIEKL